MRLRAYLSAVAAPPGTSLDSSASVINRTPPVAVREIGWGAPHRCLEGGHTVDGQAPRDIRLGERAVEHHQTSCPERADDLRAEGSTARPTLPSMRMIGRAQQPVPRLVLDVVDPAGVRRRRLVCRRKSAAHQLVEETVGLAAVGNP
jgi:hypothetical protein